MQAIVCNFAYSATAQSSIRERFHGSGVLAVNFNSLSTAKCRWRCPAELMAYVPDVADGQGRRISILEVEWWEEKIDNAFGRVASGSRE